MIPRMLDWNEMDSESLSDQKIEIRQSSHGKGDGVFASQDIKKGEVIFLTKTMYSEGTYADFSRNFAEHGYTNEFFSKFNQQRKWKKDLPLIGTLNQEYVSTVYNLANSNVYNVFPSVQTMGIPIGYVFSAVGSFINHQCQEWNADYHPTPNRMVLIANMDIKCGEEITISYGNDKIWFKCRCVWCVAKKKKKIVEADSAEKLLTMALLSNSPTTPEMFPIFANIAKYEQGRIKLMLQITCAMQIAWASHCESQEIPPHIKEEFLREMNAVFCYDSEGLPGTSLEDDLKILHK